MGLAVALGGEDDDWLELAVALGGGDWVVLTPTLLNMRIVLSMETS